MGIKLLFPGLSLSVLHLMARCTLQGASEASSVYDVLIEPFTDK